MRALLSVWIATAAAVGLAEPCGTTVHDWPAGSHHVVFTDNSRFYYGAGTALVAAAPDQAGGLSILGHSRLHHGYAFSSAASAGRYALVGTAVVDLGTPNLPETVGEFTTPGWPVEIRITGNTAFVRWFFQGDHACGSGIEVVDISNPTQPSIESRIDITPCTYSGSIQVIPDWLYILRGGHLEIFNISDPADPTLAAEFDEPAWDRLLTVEGNTMLVDADGELLFVSVDNPTIPQLQTAYEPSSRVEHALWVEDNLLLAAGENFEVVDVSSITPFQKALVNGAFPDAVASMAAMGDTCLVIENEPYYSNEYFRLIDISNLSTPSIGDPWIRPRGVTDVSGSQSRVGVLTNHALWLLDLEPDGHTIEYPAVEFDRADNVDLQDDRAFVGKGREDGTGRGFYLLQVLDVETGNQAEVVGEIELDLGFDSDPHDLPQASGDGWVAVASGNHNEGRLGVVDVSESQDPTQGTTIPLSKRPSQMIAVDDLLYLLIDNGLIVVDVSDPHNARPIGGFDDTPSWEYVLKIATWGRYVYLVGRDTIYILDASTPSSLSLVGLLDYSGHPDAVSGQGGFLFAHEGDAITIFDVRNPAEAQQCCAIESVPCRISRYDGGQGFAFGDVFVQAGNQCGVQTIDISECTDSEDEPAANFTVTPAIPEIDKPVQFHDHSAGEPTAWSWNFGDGTSSTDAQPQHSFTEPGTHIVTLTVSNAFGSNRSELSLEVIDPNAALTADFDWSNDEPSVRSAVQFIDRSAGQATSWSWEFGDGYHSNSESPSHNYSLPGAYEVTLQVGDASETSTITKTIPVVPWAEDTLPHYSSREVIAAAASTPGRHGTHWRTDLTIFNTSDVGIWARVHFIEGGDQNNFWSPGSHIFLHPRETVAVKDVVGDLFGLEKTSGALLVYDGYGELLTSRTLTDDPGGGTYGQGVPSRKSQEDYDNLPQVVLGLRQDEDFRSNVGFVSLYNDPYEFTATVHDVSGDAVGELPVLLPEFGYLQVDQVLKTVGGNSVKDGYLTLTAPRWLVSAYASVIDNHTGDAVFIPSQTADPDAPVLSWIVPAVASVNGANGTRWQSQIDLLNPSDESVDVVIQLIENGSHGPPTKQHVLTLDEGQMTRIDDVVEELFGLKTTGALLIQSSPPIHVTSRTFATHADGEERDGTFGQNISAIPLSELLSTENPASLIDLRENDLYRSNLGLVNPSDNPAVVKIEVLDTFGLHQDTAIIRLDPWEHRQLNRVLQLVGGIDRATLTLTVQQGDVAAYASVVDNSTGDPVFMSALEHP